MAIRVKRTIEEKRAYRTICDLPKPKKNPGLLKCLKCDREFKSPDRVNLRLCDSCREYNQHHGDAGDFHLSLEYNL